MGHRSWLGPVDSASLRAGRAAIPRVRAGPRSKAPTNLDLRHEASRRRVAAQARTGVEAARHDVAGVEAETVAPAPNSAAQTMRTTESTTDQSVPAQRPKRRHCEPRGHRHLRHRRDHYGRRCRPDVARQAGTRESQARQSRLRPGRPGLPAPFVGAGRPCRSASPRPIRTGSVARDGAQTLRLRRPRSRGLRLKRPRRHRHRPLRHQPIRPMTRPTGRGLGRDHRGGGGGGPLRRCHPHRRRLRYL